MYKMKTCSKFKKCFKILGNGGIKRKRTGKNHFLHKKPKRAKGLLQKNIMLSGKMLSLVKKRMLV